MGCQIATRHSGEVALQIITYQEEVRNPPLQTLATQAFPFGFGAKKDRRTRGIQREYSSKPLEHHR